MRVLLVTHYFASHRGGVEIVAQELARRLAHRHPDIDITWVASASSAVESADRLVRIPVPAWNVTERRLGFPYPLWSPTSLAGIGRLAASADVVHLHDSLYLGNIAAFLAARHRRTPVLVTQHIGTVPYSNPALRLLLAAANRTVARAVLTGSDQAVFVSPRVRAFFESLFGFRRAPQTVPNGVDTDLFFPAVGRERERLRERLGFSQGQRVRLFVGRFVEKKGLPLLRELARRAPDETFVFVGWGPDDPARWNLPNVRAVGALPQQDIADYYRAADLLLLPSVGEGFPLVVQEAMACGLPPVISAETLEGSPDAAGVIATAALDADSWHAATRRLDAGPAEDRRQRVAAFSRRWNWDGIADRYAGLLRAAAGTR